MNKAVTFKLTALIFFMLLLGATIATAATPQTSYTISSGMYPNGTVTVYEDSGSYYAKNEFGYSLAVGTSASAVIEAAWEAMTDGGTIHLKGTINLGADGVVLYQTKNTKNIILEGEGKTATILSYTGTDAALTIDTQDATLGYYNVKIADFQILCNGNGDGLRLENMGRTVTVHNLDIENTDTAIYIKRCNVLYFYDCRVNGANIGVNIQPSDEQEISNELAFFDCTIIWTLQYSYFVEGANNVNWYGGGVSPRTGYGIYFNGVNSDTINGVHFEDCAASFNNFIEFNSISSSFPNYAVKIEGCYFNAHNNTDYAIMVKYGEQINVDTCTFNGISNAAIELKNEIPNGVHVVQPYLLGGTPQVFGAATLTQLSTRCSGSALTDHAFGVVVVSDIATSAGDVLYLSSNGVYTSFSPSGNEKNPAVVLFGGGANQPIVIAASGIAQVNCDGSVTTGDTLVVDSGSGAHKLATVNNAQTDASLILGHALETSSGAGLKWALID